MSEQNQDPASHYLGDPIHSTNDLLSDRPGIIGMLTSAFYSGLGGWLMLANLLVLIATGFLLWSGFRFFTAATKALN